MERLGVELVSALNSRNSRKSNFFKKKDISKYCSILTMKKLF